MYHHKNYTRFKNNRCRNYCSYNLLFFECISRTYIIVKTVLHNLNFLFLNEGELLYYYLPLKEECKRFMRVYALLYFGNEY